MPGCARRATTPAQAPFGGGATRRSPSASEAAGSASRASDGKFLGRTCGEDSWVADFWALKVKRKSDEERRSRKLEKQQIEG